jgi:O-acetyl-ADP-ribose deacetylase
VEETRPGRGGFFHTRFRPPAEDPHPHAARVPSALADAVLGGVTPREPFGILRGCTGLASRATALTYGGGVAISLVLGDITQQNVDAIVNAANSSLLGGGGVDGAIHRRGGPAILAECRELRATSHPGGLPTGQAVATTAGNLAARWVIHTVGPVYSAREDRSDLLASCYAESLRVADQVGARTVAFPAISAGIYRWPLDDAARIAVETVGAARGNVEDVRFVLFSEDVYTVFERALERRGQA